MCVYTIKMCSVYTTHQRISIRLQIHILEGAKVRIYSRNQENNTSKYPDVISRMPAVLKEGTTSCIIDSEAVAWDREKKQILPFQVLSTRKRKVEEILH